MKRFAMMICLLFAPCLMLLNAAGCEQEVRTVDRETTVQQSEPKMVSPGKEVLE